MTPKNSPRYKRDGITSYLLISERTCRSENLSVTLVDMEPGGIQMSHKHEPEQTYTILEGSGIMHIAGEDQKVGVGDCIFIPSWAEHGLKNTGADKLRYLSASSPSFTRVQCKDWWPLPSLEKVEA
jgi:mannose-6-phosphate isomerase-like protein (cupin superfamily)